MKVYDSFTGILRNSTDVIATDRLIELKKSSGTNPWPVISEILKIWADKSPKEWKSYLIRLQDIKRTRKDRKFASTYDKVNKGYLRYILDIPQKVISMIRCLYTADELPMNRKFFIEFARRFPRLKVAEKL